ncbi:MAG: glycosyltransferase family 9 protein [Parachlamydiales bacterium]|nr:glycosyltransferase family 9 protein [Parachlamydiales bacterium]
MSNIAHLGDVVISTGVLPHIKEKYPDAKIGFICGSWASDVVTQHPLIDKVYFVDHRILNRSDISILKKMFSYFRSKYKALKEIKKEKYDIAIDLYFFFPNCIHLFFKSKIPTRIGYTSGGYKNFLTHTLEWIEKDQHVSIYQSKLLEFLDIKKTGLKYLNPLITVERNFDPVLSDIIKKDYVVFHIGSGDQRKNWPIDNWKILTKKAAEKIKIVFTGKGSFENKQIENIIQNNSNCFNFCDKLNYKNLVQLIDKAKSIVCTDSLISHISSALNKQTLVLFSNVNNPQHWIMKKENIHQIVFGIDSVVDIDFIYKRLFDFIKNAL